MARHGIGAAEAELRGDFLRRRHCAVRFLAFFNEIKNLLLSSGQTFHSVYLDTMTPHQDVKRELFTINPVGLAIRNRLD